MKASNLPVLMHSKIVVKMSPANSRGGIWEVLPCHKVLPIIFWKPFWREKASEGGLTSPPITKERVQRWRGETWGWKACREHVVPLQWSLAAVQHKVSWFHQVWRPCRDTEQLRKGSAWEKGFCAPEQMVFSSRLGLCSCLLARGQGEVETQHGKRWAWIHWSESHLNRGRAGIYLKAAVRDIYLPFPTDVPVTSTPVTASYHGCMTLKLNNTALDLDEALYKHSDITSHSCPPVQEDQ